MSFRETAKRFNQMLQTAEQHQLTHLVDLLRWLTSEVKGRVCYEQFRESISVFSLYSWYQVKQNLTEVSQEGAPERFTRLSNMDRLELMQKLFGRGAGNEVTADECSACTDFYAAASQSAESLSGFPLDVRNDTEYLHTAGLTNLTLGRLLEGDQSPSLETGSQDNVVSAAAVSGTADSEQRQRSIQVDQAVQTDAVKSVWHHAVQVGAASFVLGMFSQAAVQSLVGQSEFATQLLSMSLTRSMQLPQGGSVDLIKSLPGTPILIFFASSFLIGVGALVGYTQAPSIEKISGAAGLKK
jgi:hypothetical protein